MAFHKLVVCATRRLDKDGFSETEVFCHARYRPAEFPVKNVPSARPGCQLARKVEKYCSYCLVGNMKCQGEV